MKFFIDADSPYSLLKIFRKHGYEAIHVRDVMPFAKDDEILEYARKNQCIIVTRDLGIAHMFVKSKGYGVIVSRLPSYFTAEKIIRIFDTFLEESDTRTLVNSIIVIELGRYRIRKV